MKKLQMILMSAMALPISISFADDAADTEAVIGIVEDFFAAMTAGDIDRMRQILTVDGVLYGYREDPDGLLIIRP